MTKQEVLPCSIESTKVDQEKARVILLDNKNYIVRYLRQYPTVGLATLPVRNAGGEIIGDMDWVRKRVICAGVPYACLIAFKHQDKLLIGWSKRLETRKLIETEGLHSLFKSAILLKPDVGDSYDDLFSKFASELLNFLTFQEPKDVEIAFSKKAGKTAAIIRGLRDDITIYKDSFVKSGASGPVPHDVSRNLRWFVEHAEEAFGGKAANVGYPELVPTKADGILPVAA
jgi:hypothetical protein